MSCPSQTYAGGETPGFRWESWSGRNFGTVTMFDPRTLPDLVNVVQRAEREGRRLRVIGSGWSFENIAFSPEWMVRLGSLKKRIFDVIPAALNQRWADLQVSDPNSRLFHVMAGITLADLSDALAAAGLALPTMGGSNGQTLGGAISTSTHGGDISLPPLPDLVMAMHLVTVGGREVWVERASEPITDDVPLAMALECPDAEIIRNDDLFDSLLVGFGRFGIVYSYVLRVGPSFRLAEWTTEVPRFILTELLRQGVSQRTFLAPLLSILPDPPPALGAINPKNPRGFNVIFNTQKMDTCFVRRRWLTQGADLNVAWEPNPMCQKGAAGILHEAVAPYRGVYAGGAGAATVATAIVAGTFSFGLGAVIVSAASQALAAALAVKLEEQAHWLEVNFAQNPSMRAGDMLALVLRSLWNLGLGDEIAKRGDAAFRDALPTLFGTRAGDLTAGVHAALSLLLS